MALKDLLTENFLGVVSGISVVAMMIMATSFWVFAMEDVVVQGDDDSEIEQTPPPSLPNPSSVVDDIETLVSTNR